MTTEKNDAHDQPDTTEPLGGASSGEDGYVAVNAGGASVERHVPTADEEIGRGEQLDQAGTFDPETQAAPADEADVDGVDELEQAPQARPASD